MSKPACFFAGWPGAGSCDGALIRAHLIPKRLMKREWAGMEELRGKGVELRDVLRDVRGWVPCCGGPCGNGGHHGMLDTARTLRIPRERIPAAVEEFAAELGLLWFLDREYGEAAA